MGCAGDPACFVYTLTRRPAPKVKTAELAFRAADSNIAWTVGYLDIEIATSASQPLIIAKLRAKIKPTIFGRKWAERKLAGPIDHLCGERERCTDVTNQVRDSE